MFLMAFAGCLLHHLCVPGCNFSSILHHLAILIQSPPALPIPPGGLLMGLTSLLLCFFSVLVVHTAVAHNLLFRAAQLPLPYVRGINEGFDGVLQCKVLLPQFEVFLASLLQHQGLLSPLLLRHNGLSVLLPKLRLQLVHRVVLQTDHLLLLLHCGLCLLQLLLCVLVLSLNFTQLLLFAGQMVFQRCSFRIRKGLSLLQLFLDVGNVIFAVQKHAVPLAHLLLHHLQFLLVPLLALGQLAGRFLLPNRSIVQHFACRRALLVQLRG
mmetsp:Transcript_4243/g.7849  ORF Transcript_4243/g.7849 Transcript_4243/m.7849 type:complete len:267 (+) Transcript_4243:141-941(+)